MCSRFKSLGIRTSIFVDPNPEMVRGAALCGADRVELYTAAYAEQYVENREAAVRPYLEAALAAKEAGLGLNAGHDLNLENLSWLISNIPWTDEVTIGKALISYALYFGLQNTVAAYLAEIRKK